MNKKWRQFLKNKFAVLSAIFLILISTAAVCAPLVTHYSYDDQNIMERLQGPSLQHWLGTDTLGRDLYSRIIYGARVSLAVGIVTTFFAAIVGTVVGATAGYAGGWVDAVLMRGVDVFYIFPSTLMAILFTLLFGRGMLGILAALSFTSWVTQARLVRGQVLLTRELLYVEAARALGVNRFSLIFRHILPNILGPILVSFSIQIPTNIMTESFLSFIGLGLQPPHSSWGTLANEGFRAIHSYPYLMIFPCTVLFLTLMAFNYLEDGLTRVALR